MRDASRKGRIVAQIGSRSPNAKLTEDDVRVIRERFDAGEYQHKIAADFGVGNTTVWNIGHRKRWTHVDSEGV